MFEASLAGGFAYFLNLKLNPFGVNIGWPWLALGMVADHRHADLLRRPDLLQLLAIGLISEILILLIFDVFLFASGHVTAARSTP